MRPLSIRRFAHSGYLKLGEETYSCQISNMSATGATIAFDGPIDVPDEFLICLTAGGRIPRKCSVVWREGIEIGVIFTRSRA
jgi:hypothetical protein